MLNKKEKKMSIEPCVQTTHKPNYFQAYDTIIIEAGQSINQRHFFMSQDRPLPKLVRDYNILDTMSPPIGGYSYRKLHAISIDTNIKYDDEEMQSAFAKLSCIRTVIEQKEYPNLYFGANNLTNGLKELEIFKCELTRLGTNDLHFVNALQDVPTSENCGLTAEQLKQIFYLDRNPDNKYYYLRINVVVEYGDYAPASYQLKFND